jgi:glycosyltransferase involved in cell wall biosynthesis
MKYQNTQITPLVSVCLITYNHEKYIRKSIEGVLSQATDFPIEIVIGEDCSTDNTYSICKEYENIFKNEIRIIKHDKNIGLNSNFISTVKKCAGKYIAYLEGDDWWIKNDKLQKQINILEKDTSISLVHTNFKAFDEYNNTYIDEMIKYSGECIREKISGLKSVYAEYYGKFRPIKTSTICYRKKHLDEILNEDLFAYENKDFMTQDFQLFQDLAYRGKFVFINDDTTVSALHDSISNPKSNEKRLKFYFSCFKIGCYYIDKYRIPQDAINIWMRKELYYFLNYGLKYNDEDILKNIIKYSSKRGYILPFRQYIKYLAYKVISFNRKKLLLS